MFTVVPHVHHVTVLARHVDVDVVVFGSAENGVKVFGCCCCEGCECCWNGEGGVVGIGGGGVLLE